MTIQMWYCLCYKNDSNLTTASIPIKLTEEYFISVLSFRTVFNTVQVVRRIARTLNGRNVVCDMWYLENSIHCTNLITGNMHDMQFLFFAFQK